MNHHRLLFAAIFSDILEAETFRLHKIQLHGSDLVFAADRVGSHKVNLGPVKGGFALFFVRSVAASRDYIDAVTKRPVRAVSTQQIYRGSIAFVILQLVMVAVLLRFPELVTDRLDRPVQIGPENLTITPERGGYGDADADPMKRFESGSAAPAEEPGTRGEEDPTSRIRRALERDAAR